MLQDFYKAAGVSDRFTTLQIKGLTLTNAYLSNPNKLI